MAAIGISRSFDVQLRGFQGLRPVAAPPARTVCPAPASSSSKGASVISAVSTVDSGRIGGAMKKSLREIIEKYSLDVRLTPNQNIILCGIRREWKQSIIDILAKAGILDPTYIDPLNLSAMACPALPLCPLAITEAERGIPSILKRVRAVFDKVGLRHFDSLVVRVTGCPNGCARPYMAELGFVGDGPNSYQIWIGGTANQTALARCFMNKIKIHDLEKVLEPLFSCWKTKRLQGESFGDFTIRVGFDELSEAVKNWNGGAEELSPFSLSVSTGRNTYEAMGELAQLQNKTAGQLAAEVIDNYVAAQQNGKGE